jgi:hypothetical protein
MATTTPNYGWTVPTSTDLVKDGATAIETLGDAVDATVYANAQAALSKTIVDAKGDLIAATAADTVARLAVGANGTVLKANSSTSTGLEWGSASATKNWTLVNTGGTSLSGSSTQITGLSSYDDLLVIVSGASFTAAGQGLYMTVNNVTTSSSYTRYGMRNDYATSYASSNYTTFASATGTEIQWSSMSDNAASTVSGGIMISGCKGTGVKPYVHVSASTAGGGNGNDGSAYMGVVTATTAISSIEIIGISATFDAGTVFVYGA